MYLVNLTLQPSSSVHLAAIGNFSGLIKGAQELALIKGSGTILELLTSTPKLKVISSFNLFGIIQSMSVFRPTGSIKDLLLLGSDSGRLIILEYDPNTKTFSKIISETFGRSGIRRSVPGAFVAADPRGRSLMIAALEKQKFVYVVGNNLGSDDSESLKLSISSPLEAHKSHVVTSAVLALDVGFDGSPTWACLEVDGSLSVDASNSRDQGTKKLVFYELDLGINHVARKSAEVVPFSAHRLIQVPGGSDGPGGLLMVTEGDEENPGNIFWKLGSHSCSVAMPRCSNGESSSFIICNTVYKSKTAFFYLLQNESKDLFKLVLNVSEDLGIVTEMVVVYFDTLLSRCTSLCLFRSGMLFAASEYSSNYLFQIQALADSEEEQKHNPQFFARRSELLNLKMIDEIDSISPSICSKALQIAHDETPFIFVGNGSPSSQSYLSILRQGLPITELGCTEMPGTPCGVWTLKNDSSEKHHSFIVVSFINATIVLLVSDSIEELPESDESSLMKHIDRSKRTIKMVQFSNASYIQVLEDTVRYVSGSKIAEWKPPAGVSVVLCVNNSKQLLIALSTNIFIVLEIENSLFKETSFKNTENASQTITSLGLSPISEGRISASFAVVGYSDCTIRVFSLIHKEMLSFHSLPHMATSLSFEKSGSLHGTINLLVGLQSGLVVKLSVDEIAGHLSSSASNNQFLGALPISSFLSFSDQTVLAISSRPWLFYEFSGKAHASPLFTTPSTWTSAAEFLSEATLSGIGIVAVVDNYLKILVVEKLGKSFSQSNIPLNAVPRCILSANLNLVDKSSNDNLIIVLESEQRKLAPAKKKDNISNDDEDIEMEVEDDESSINNTNHDGSKHAWLSFVRIFDPRTFETKLLFPIEESNEGLFSGCILSFMSDPVIKYLALGTASMPNLLPNRICNNSSIRLYKVRQQHQLQLVHITPLGGGNQLPTAMASFQGRLLVAFGRSLKMFDIGKKRLLLKTETKSLPCSVVKEINVMGNRVFLLDSAGASICLLVWRPDENMFSLVVEDGIPRWGTSCSLLDVDTIIGGDKFGNIFVVQVPVSYNNSTSSVGIHKFDDISEYYLGDILTAISKTTLQYAGRELLLYTTITGAIGVLIPVTSRSELSFLQNLEMILRAEQPPLSGREHLSFRSSILPVKNIIDGDLLESFSLLSKEKQILIADSLDITTGREGIIKRLSELRLFSAF